MRARSHQKKKKNILSRTSVKKLKCQTAGTIQGYIPSKKLRIHSIQNTRITQLYQRNNLIKKMGRVPAQTFFQKRHTDGQQTQEKMLNKTNH